MEKIPENYLINGLEAVSYSKPDKRSEAVSYKTPNGTSFVIAKDFLGIQICMRGQFWPPPFTSFPNMGIAVEYLRAATNSAIDFFDEMKSLLDKELEQCRKE
jgi:hypothetical protein